MNKTYFDAMKLVGNTLGGKNLKEKEAKAKAQPELLKAIAALIGKGIAGEWLTVTSEDGKKAILGVEDLAVLQAFIEANGNIDINKLQAKYTAVQVKLGQVDVEQCKENKKMQDDTTATEPQMTKATEAKDEKSPEDPIVTALKARDLVCQCPACKANPDAALKGKGSDFKVPAIWTVKGAAPEDLVGLAVHKHHAWRLGNVENTAWFAFGYVGLQKVGQRQERYEADKAEATKKLTGKAQVCEGDIGWWGYTGRGDFRQVRRLKDCVVPPMDYVRANTRGPVDPPTLMAFAIPKGLAGKMKPHQNAGLVASDFYRLDHALADLWSNFACVVEKPRNEMEPQGGTHEEYTAEVAGE